LNSHTHYDHIGGNRHFEQIAAHEGDFSRERLAAGASDLSRLITAESVWKPLPPGFDPKNYRIPPVVPTRVVREGEILDLGGRKLEILFTPGHTADSLCLLDRAHRILFTGDTFYPAPLYAHTPDANFEDYHRSAQRLGQLAGEVDTVCPGHNEARVVGAVLPKLATAFEAIRSGEAKPNSEESGVSRFDFDGFSVLVRRKK
jgi:glyoxylase-like metal-dependent hydrolase (beta-lactamase superfamily II)